MEQKSKRLLIAGGIVGFVILCLAVIFFVLYFTGLLGFLGFGQAQGPKYMPEDTWLYVSLNPTLEDQSGYQHIAGKYEDLEGIEDAQEEIMLELEEKLGMTFEEDVKPWIGSEIGLGVFGSVDMVVENPALAVVVQVRNEGKAEQFMDDLIDVLEEDFEVDEDDYQDFEYYLLEDEYTEETFALAMVKGYLVFSVGEDSMEEVIDTRLNDQDNLADDTRFKEVSGSLPDNSVAKVIYDLDKMDSPVQSLSYFLDMPPSLSVMEAFTTASMGVALDISDEGLQIDYSVYLDVDELPEEVLENMNRKPSPQNILKTIPESSLAFISGDDLASTWENALNQIEEISSDLNYQLLDIGEFYGIRIDADLLSWATGEYALALIDAQAMDGEIPMGGFFIQEVSDPDDAEEFVDNILALLGMGMGGMNFHEREFGGREFQMAGSDIMGEDLFGYGITDKDQLVIGVTEEAFDRLLSGDSKPIRNNSQFKSVRKHLPDKNTGYLYVNVDSLTRHLYFIMDEYAREEFNQDVQPFIEPIKAFGAASTGMDPKSGLTQGAIFIYIP
jgi:hypothetical protein